MILASCYTLGIQRFDLRGRNEGSYHLGGTVSHAVPDFPGRTIATATLEGELAVINSGGNVRWRTELPRPVVALEVDPLGRYMIYGHSTGEIVRLDLFGGKQGRPASGAAPRPAAASGQTSGSAAGSVRSPDWLIPVVETEQQAETAVLDRRRRPSRNRPVHQPASPSALRHQGQETRAGARLAAASAGSSAPPRAGSPPPPTVRSSSATSGATRSPGSTSAWCSSLIWPSSPTTSASRWSRNAIASAGSPPPADGSGSTSCVSRRRPGRRPPGIRGNHHQWRPASGLRPRRRVHRSASRSTPPIHHS